MILFILIFFTMVIVVGASAVLGFSFYVKRRKRLPASEDYRPIEPPPYRPLFAPSDEEVAAFEQEETALRENAMAETTRKDLLLRAEGNDLNVLTESKNDTRLYGEALSVLIRSADSDEKITAIAEFILKNELSSNIDLPEKFGEIRRKNPDRKSTIDYVELAARSGSARSYLDALETVANDKSLGNLSFLTDEDFILIVEANFRILPAEEKASGTGFLIKQKLLEIQGKGTREKG